MIGATALLLAGLGLAVWKWPRRMLVTCEGCGQSCRVRGYTPFHKPLRIKVTSLHGQSEFLFLRRLRLINYMGNQGGWSLVVGATESGLKTVFVEETRACRELKRLVGDSEFAIEEASDAGV